MYSVPFMLELRDRVGGLVGAFVFWVEGGRLGSSSRSMRVTSVLDSLMVASDIRLTPN